MHILIAEDDPVSRRALEMTLTRWGHVVATVSDGAAAWACLQGADAPRLAILDWMMPIVDGIDVCRRVQAQAMVEPPYLILLTARGTKADMVHGLLAGADDYITKPFDRDELQARVLVGERMVALRTKLADRVRELEAAITKVKQLQGLLPICSYCKKIRDDCNYWQQVEGYISQHTDIRFSHGICPECYEDVVKPQLETHAEEVAHRPSGPV
jgi:CheY-like chemotaxis protein